MSADTDMAVKVRKIVTANWLDVSQIRIRVTRGVINLQGHVVSVGGDAQNPEGSEAGMRRMDEELRNLKGFRGMSYLFDNWVREASGAWRCLTKRRDRKKGR